MSDRGIAYDALRVALFVVLAKTAIALREVVLAREFGTGPIGDAYNVAFAIGTWLPVFVAGALGSAIVPALVRAEKRNLPSEHRRFVRELNGNVFAMSLAVTAVGGIFAMSSASLFSTGRGIVDGLIENLLWFFAPFAGLTTIFYYLSNRLQAKGDFFYTAIEAIPALTISVAILLLSHEHSLVALGLAAIFGGIVQVIVLALALARKESGFSGFSLRRTSPEWDTLIAAIGIMAIGQGILSVVIPVDQYFALGIGPGAPASIGYANRLIGMATSVGTIVLARALLPRLAAAHVVDPQEAWLITRRWTTYCFGLGLAGFLIGWVLAKPLTEIVFQRGSFTAADTQIVAQLIRAGLLQLPFYFSGLVAVQWFAVEGQFGTIAMICAATLVAKLAVLMLVVADYGALGLMYSTAAMYVVAWSLQMWRMQTSRPTSETCHG